MNPQQDGQDRDAGSSRIRKTYSQYNKTPDGRVACAFGTLWRHHFDGTGCRSCDAITNGQELLDFEEDD